VKRRSAKTIRAYFSKILQLEQNFRIGAITVTVNDRFTFFVVLSQRPWRDALRIARAETGTTIRVKDVASTGLIKHCPDLETFAEFPATAVQNCASPRQLARFALIFRAFGEKVDGFLAGHFEANCFKRSVHS
jgi:hypothetical protein